MAKYRASKSADPRSAEKDRSVKVSQHTDSAISVLCGRGEVRGRAAPFRGRSIGMAPEHHFETAHRSHDLGIAIATVAVCGVVVAAAYRIACSLARRNNRIATSPQCAQQQQHREPYQHYVLPDALIYGSSNNHITNRTNIMLHQPQQQLHRTLKYIPCVQEMCG